MVHKETRELIGTFFLISLAGLLLHLRIHPPAASMFHWIPVGFGLVNAVVLPVLFIYTRTVTWGYLMTWATVVVGTAGMGYHSITAWMVPVTAKNVILQSTLPDIMILWGKLLLAHKILRIHWPGGVPAERREGCAP